MRDLRRQQHLTAATSCRATDEGVRGLFRVAQHPPRWGTRCTTHSKIIWAEQALPDTAAPGPDR
ncbi:hypothetical protein GCM10009535_59410 [Streptomyces thermocarboxydovorans]|uniref:Transposase n=1 Tax=Streptomyces thermocarboxydovorans TaxID=59298 RepID=A0ABP3T227_9ACTN